MNVEEKTRHALESTLAFIDRLRDEPHLRIESFEMVEAPAPDELDAFESETGRPLPAEVRACFERGMFHCRISGDEEYHFGQVEFSSLAAIKDQLSWWGDQSLADQIESELAAEGGADDDMEYNQLQVDHLRYGIPLWADDNTIVVDSRTGAVGRHDGEGGPADRICDDLCEFFQHFAAAGLFNYGGASKEHFEVYWEIVKELVPFAISPQENKWLQHLDRWYRGDLTA